MARVGEKDLPRAVGLEADWRLRICNAEWLTLRLIEATLIWITHRLGRFTNVR